MMVVVKANRIQCSSKRHSGCSRRMSRARAVQRDIELEGNSESTVAHNDVAVIGSVARGLEPLPRTESGTGVQCELALMAGASFALLRFISSRYKDEGATDYESFAPLHSGLVFGTRRRVGVVERMVSSAQSVLEFCVQTAVAKRLALLNWVNDSSLEDEACDEAYDRFQPWEGPRSKGDGPKLPPAPISRRIGKTKNTGENHHVNYMEVSDSQHRYSRLDDESYASSHRATRMGRDNLATAPEPTSTSLAVLSRPESEATKATVQSLSLPSTEEINSRQRLQFIAWREALHEEKEKEENEMRRKEQEREEEAETRLKEVEAMQLRVNEQQSREIEEKRLENERKMDELVNGTIPAIESKIKKLEEQNSMIEVEEMTSKVNEIDSVVKSIRECNVAMEARIEALESLASKPAVASDAPDLVDKKVKALKEALNDISSFQREQASLRVKLEATLREVSSKLDVKTSTLDTEIGELKRKAYNENAEISNRLEQVEKAMDPAALEAFEKGLRSRTLSSTTITGLADRIEDLEEEAAARLKVLENESQESMGMESLIKLTQDALDLLKEKLPRLAEIILRK